MANDWLLTNYGLYFRGFNLHIRDIIKKHIFDDITKAQNGKTKKKMVEWIESQFTVYRWDELDYECTQFADMLLIDAEQWEALCREVLEEK